MDGEDSNDKWVPPTEAEMKIIEAKRERSDKISKAIGHHLLKGYKMLNSTCSDCWTILLEDREGGLYCVACSEVDNEHTKDNPALSGVAARRQIEEAEHRTNDSGTSSTQSQNGNMECATETNTGFNEASTTAVRISNNSNWYSQGEDALKETIAWAAQGLHSNHDISNSIQYCTLIKMCADAYISLKAVKDTK